MVAPKNQRIGRAEAINTHSIAFDAPNGAWFCYISTQM